MTRAADLAKLIAGGGSITVSDNSENLKLITTDADASVGPTLRMDRQSSSAADSDLLGKINFVGHNDAGTPEDIAYAGITAIISDASDGTEDGKLAINTIVAGTERSRIFVDAGETVFNEDSIDVDFRVESDANTHALFVEGSSGSVKLGTTSDPSHGTADSHVLALSGKQNNGSGTLAFIDTAGNSDALLLGDSGSLTINVDSSNATADSSLQIRVDNSEKMRIDADGNVGIGDSSPESNTNFTALTVTSTSGTGGGQVYVQSSSVNSVFGADAASSDPKSVLQTVTDHPLQIGTNNTGRMRIGNSGNVSIATTSTGGNSALTITASSFSGGIKIFGANGQVIQSFEVGGNVVGRIEVNNSATIYSTSSDYRLKENVVTDWDATSRLKQLKPSRFNFKTDKATTMDGFLAHEVSSIVPEAISGEKDAVDADGNIEPQGIDQSKLVPLMVKTIQELEARIATLESK